MTSIVTVFVKSLDTYSERRLDPHITVSQLKTKLETITGIPLASQEITLHAQDTEEEVAPTVLAVFNDDERQLGYYGIRDWQVLKVKDTNPATAALARQYTDVSRVEKFEISKEDYAARRDTVLAYKQTHKVGRFASPAPRITEALPAGISVGSRCEVDSGDESLKRRGVVQFVGSTQFAKGNWVGVEYDEPVGKNDGSVQGVRYFTTRPSYGGFVRPDHVRVGDFPVEDLGLDEEDEI